MYIHTDIHTYIYIYICNSTYIYIHTHANVQQSSHAHNVHTKLIQFSGHTEVYTCSLSQLCCGQLVYRSHLCITMRNGLCVKEYIYICVCMYVCMYIYIYIRT